MTGKTPPVCSDPDRHGATLARVFVHAGRRWHGRPRSGRPLLAQTSLSTVQMMPVGTVTTTRDRGKGACHRLVLSDMEDREEGFLRHVDTAEGLHPLLAFSACSAASYGPRRHRSTWRSRPWQGLDRAAGDDLVADGGLMAMSNIWRGISLAHLHHLATAILGVLLG